MIIFLYLKSRIITLETFFPSSIVEWNKLSRKERSSENIRIFKKRLLEFIRPSSNSIFDMYNPYGIKQLTRLRLGLSHLNKQKFKHGFNDTINPICVCRGDIESINHFFPTVLNTVKHGKPSLTTFKTLIKCY